MKKMNPWMMGTWIFGFLVIQLSVISVQNACVAAESGSAPFKDVVITPLLQGYFVDGDEGRFRQDWRVSDGLSAGFESFEAKTQDDKVEMSATIISDNDYYHTVKIMLPDDQEIRIKGKYFRQYYDGSNEPWDTAVYRQPAEFADWEDEDLYADRLSESIEYVKNVGEDTRWTLGYDLWGRFGRERLLRGEESTATGFFMNRRSIPTRAYLDGVSHTLYAEYAHTFAQKWNLKVRPSYEIYADYQDIQFYRFNANGVLNQARTFLDSPKFQDINTHVSLDGFYNDDVYLYSGYLFTYLQNNSVRSEVRPGGASTWTDPSVDNVRIGNAGNLGAVILNFLGIKDLRFSASSRVEGANTDSNGYGYTGTATRGNFGHKELRSDLEDFKVSESASLLYKGIRNATFELSGEAEHRRMGYDEYFDAGSYEGFVDFGAVTRFFSYDADMDWNDFKTTARTSYRFNQHLKASGQYRVRYQDHDVTVNSDSELVFYPGVILDTRREVHEATAGFDIWWFESWSSGLKYQYISDDFHTERAGLDVQDSDRHRVTANLIGQPAPKLTLVGSATFESYFLDTPANPVPGSTWFEGTAPFDYDGDYFIYNVSGSWSVTDADKLHGRFQQTSSLGTVSDVQKTDFHEIGVGLSHKFDPGALLKLEYFFFEFNDKNDVVPGFDDYDGHGFICSFQKKF